jgi:hypothetical protein
VAAVKLLAELEARQGSRLGRCLALVTALLLACSGAAEAHYNTQVFSLTDSHCPGGGGCTPSGTPPSFGTVTVSQDPSSHQTIDFTIRLNDAFSASTTNFPLFAINFSPTVTSAVTFGAFSTTGVSQAPPPALSNTTADNYGSFSYVLLHTGAFSSNLSVLSFTATIASGTLTPDNIFKPTGHTAYMTADIIQLMGGTGNVAAILAPAPEPAGLGLFAVALAGLGVVRRRRPRR